MNAFSPDDFGDTADLLRALGLVGSDGEFNSDWLANPERYLKTILADEDQRAALLDFVSTVRGGETERDSENRIWIELISEDLGGGSRIVFYFVIDESPASYLHLFVGVQYRTGAPLAESKSTLMFPMFRAAKGTTPLGSPQLVGRSGGYVSVSSEVTIATAPAAPGDAGLQAIGLRLLVPTTDADGDPQVALTLRGLQLPGESTPRDLTLSLTDPDALREAGLELIIGLVQAQTGGAVGSQIMAFAKMVGLGKDPAIPDLPVEDIFARGIDALADWLGSALGDAAPRTAWLQALAELFGNGATVNGSSVVLPVGTATFTFGLAAVTGVSGRKVITASASFGFGSGGADVAIAADLVRIDLGSGAAIAVPTLRAEARFDLSAVVIPNISIDTLVLGFGLDEARRPALVVEVLNAVVFNTTHPKLDLTNPDALAATAAQAVNDALNDLLGNLGPASDLIAVSLGWKAPAGAGAGYPRVDILEFLGNPIGVLRAHWQEVIDNHAADFDKVLASLRTMVTGDTAANAVTGTGSESDPWQLPIVAGLHLAVWKDGAGNILFGVGFLRQVDTLGERCTVIETRVRAAIVSIDLAGGTAGFLPEISVRALGRARGGGPLSTDQGGLRLEMDYLGLVALWTPDNGLNIGHEAPNLKVYVDGVDVAIPIPDFSGSFDDLLASFEPAHWDAIERLVALMTQHLGIMWLSDLVDALGWNRSAPVLGPPERHRLRLAALIDDAEAALREWMSRLLADGSHAVKRQLQPLARFLSGNQNAVLNVDGEGTLRDPWRVSLTAAAGVPAIAVWRQPDVPIPVPDPLISVPLRKWRPGHEGLDIGNLAGAIETEFPDINGPFGAGLAAGVLYEGLSTIYNLWQGGDGWVSPPSATVPGATLHLVENQTSWALFDGIDLAEILGVVPATRINITVQSASSPIDPDLDPAFVLDMREAGRDPLAFTPLPASSGVWHILLAPRADAALPSGDPDGVRGQVTRLRHALSLIADQPNAAVVADAAAGHACWLALHEMGSGLDQLVTIGLPTEAAQVPSPLMPVTAEILRRLAEFMPEIDPADPDDTDLARARSLLKAYMASTIDMATELGLPIGWTGARRADLNLHLVYGVLGKKEIKRALTALLAAGLSLNAQVRSAARQVQQIKSASLGVWLPLNSSGGASRLVSQGHILTELIGADIDATGAVPNATLRDARRIVGALELRRRGGWLIGGPLAAPIPLDLELRSLEVDLQLTLGGPEGDHQDRCRIILHGLRVQGRSFPRVVLSADIAEGDLGIDGLASPTTPEIRQILNNVMAELGAAADPTLQYVNKALRAAGILGPDGVLDAVSLSNWVDDPAARLADLLANSVLRAELMDMLGDLFGNHSGLGFDAGSGTLSVDLSGATGLPLLAEWAITANIGRSGVTGAALRLGAMTETYLDLNLAPFSAGLHLDTSLADAIGGAPATVPLWPRPDIDRMIRTAFPAIVATALSRILDGLRRSDAGVLPVVDGALTALGLLEGAGASATVKIPPLMFINPGLWLRSNVTLGSLDGSSIRPDRVIALIDALKPLVDLGGGPGVWDIAPGLSLRARDQAGLVLDISFDAAAFGPAADVAVGGAFGLRFATDGRVVPDVALFVGLATATSGNQAVHLRVSGSDIQVFLRNGAGTDLGVYPNAGDLGQLATAGVTAALPMVLDAIVSTGSDAGNLLADIGDALVLRQGGSFDGPALVAWANDPAGALFARWPQLLSAGLNRLNAALPPGITVTGAGGTVRLVVADVGGLVGSDISVEFTPSPIAVEFGGTFSSVPFAQTVDFAIRFDQTGLTQFSTTTGPAAIPIADGIDLRPILSLDIGTAVASPFVSVGLAMDAANTSTLMLRYDFNSAQFDLSMGTGTPLEIAAGIMTFAIDLLGAFLLELDEINTFLDQPIFQSQAAATTDIRRVLSGVVLKPSGTALDTELFRIVRTPGESVQQLIDSKLDRIAVLLSNISVANPTVRIGGVLNIGLSNVGGAVGISLSLVDRLPIIEGSIAIWLENDSRWIIGGPTPGLTVALVKRTGGKWEFKPSLEVDGVGIRIGSTTGLLLDSPLALGSIALHVFARVSEGEFLGGAQVQLSEIAVAMGGGGGSDSNPIAGGMLAETSSGDAELAPAFSPALSIQTRPAPPGGIAFGFSAGDGEGPWWLPIRSQFGPLYIDQVGFGTQVANDRLQSISLLFDGNISIAGLQAAVDDLELRYRLDRGGIFDADSWEVDLAGLAVSADMSGVSLTGGLRKFGTEPNLEYVGMLSARFASFGLSIYGGYAAIQEPEEYTAFFAFGAVLGAFGGPPAFFLTGIGGGFGINRELVPPTDMSRFDDFVMIAALDPSFDPPGDLMGYMEEVRNTFPPKKDTFWFAAGISFTSFALVDGIAVVAVEFGQGFELSIFGLARMALPRPEVALVSIELGLMARFSTEEGVIWVQAQLTDNSWLFDTSARLTGGFAYVSWFNGDKAGEFVLTLGGYHPNFHRDGYPVVPRLGFNWSFGSNIVIKAEVYFALTSEAVMGGGLFEANASFGLTYANLSFGGNAIVYFDPFHYEADAHARVTAGIRIETFLGDVNLSFSLGAEIEVSGPNFHGTARVEVGPIDVTVHFGDRSPVPAALLGWGDFIQKYLELAPGNKAQALSGLAGKGMLPPASDSGTEPGTADGTAAHPFDVASEFELMLTSTIPLLNIKRGSSDITINLPRPTLGLAPVGSTLTKSELKLTLLDRSNQNAWPADAIHYQITARETGKFPIGVWGPTPNIDDKKVPKGDVISATEGVDLKFGPKFNNKIPDDATGGVAFNQIEPSPERKPLPLRAAGAIRRRLVIEARKQRKLIDALDAKRMPDFSAEWQREGRTATARRSWAHERAVPLRVGLLSERIVGSTARGAKKELGRDSIGPLVIPYGKARIRGLLIQPVRAAKMGGRIAETRVTAGRKGVVRMAPPQIRAAGGASVLLRAQLQTPIIQKTLVAKQRVPETIAANSTVSMSRVHAFGGGLDRLTAIEDMLTPAPGARRRRAARKPENSLVPGEIVVFDLPGSKNAALFENAGELKIQGHARLAVVGLDGRIIENRVDPKSMKLPAESRAFVVMAGSQPSLQDVNGWIETTRLAYLGYSLARCRGGFVRAEGASRARGGRKSGIGWIEARNLTDQSAVVETQFETGASCVAIVLDGTITAEDLELLAVSFDGVGIVEGKPKLVPMDGKTLVVYSIRASDRSKPFSVTLAGRVDDRLDGVIAAKLTPSELISRMTNSAVNLDLETYSAPESENVSAVWTAPADFRTG